MARIVDVEMFMKQFPFNKSDFSVRLSIDDPLAAWNHGTFEISSVNGEVNISKLSDELDETIPSVTIQTLTTMMLGYLRPQYLYSIERLVVENEDEIDLFEELIPNNVPCFIDYF